ncbi:septal ring lytic transglycosylase RlpA family protein [Chondrinema litorale]|uniref:septal ring lytic transglycosylase RlpA family protein n=1 Tax=Chondrinema litorale TaxID=2994555 RepID=UPI0025439EE8|nr:septal ring lytic transglycosylase RlpA family protein [Chondrinema litorale]UZR92452.1 septal ring lytic transglycosylase RlpA family protein [Chondrinema litorale]
MKPYFLITSFVLLLFNMSFADIKADYHLGYKENGQASYYGKQFHGRLTANGEKYNMYALTAAHKTIPFNSLIRVRDLETGQSVIVRVNDRGPFVKGRVLDLSLGAAREIGMIQKGVANIEIEVLRVGIGDEDPVVSAKPESKPKTQQGKAVNAKEKTSNKKDGTYSIWGTEKKAKGFGIQLNSFTSSKQMLTSAKKARAQGLEDLYVQLVTMNGKQYYRLLYKAESNNKHLQKELRQVKKAGYKNAFIREHKA